MEIKPGVNVINVKMQSTSEVTPPKGVPGSLWLILITLAILIAKVKR